VGLRCTTDEAREMMSEVTDPNEVAITCESHGATNLCKSSATILIRKTEIGP
jgi:hypothetical protein